MTMSDQTVYYVGAPGEVAHHAAPLGEHVDLRILDAAQVLREARPGDLCVFYNEFFAKYREACLELNRRGCPTLYAIDGILEWRNSWDFPEQAACPWTMRPVLSHKIACIGRSQARVLESWGNLGKCEVVGVPRFDPLAQRQPRVRSPGEPFTVLIMTAKNPGFTPEQWERTKVSLADLKHWFDSHPRVLDQPLRPRWRLTGGLDAALGVPNALRDTTGCDLATALAEADAVITTPSTAMLEAMFYRLPLALLDYHNTPHYVPAAWSIAAPQHLDQVLPELVCPPEAKLLYQDSILHDALECRTPARPRMARLIEEMLHMARQCRERGMPLEFPPRILADEQDGHHLPEEQFDLAKLYPQHPVFANLDRVALQVEAGHWQREVHRLRVPRMLLNGFDRLTASLGSHRLMRPALRWVRSYGWLGGYKKPADNKQQGV